MKALTLIRPWDQAIVRPDIGKDIENRDWRPPRSMLGQRIAIHAGRKFDWEGQRFIYHRSGVSLQPDDCPAGHIVGTAVIADVVEFSGSPWFFGRYGLKLTHRVQLRTPLACTGALGFWTVPDELEARILNELRLVGAL